MKLLKGKAKKLNVIEEEVTPVKEEPKKKKSSGNKLPSDEYKDEITPIEIPLSESGKLVVSVKRGGELGLPKVDIRFYATTEVYTGFTKKGVNIDLSVLPDLRAALESAHEQCAEKGLYEDFESEEEEEE